MLKRVLEDITNLKNKNIKVTIRKEETPIRREITHSYLEYAETYYTHMNKSVTEYAEIERAYAGRKELKIHREVKERKDAEKKAKEQFKRHIIKGLSSRIDLSETNRKIESIKEIGEIGYSRINGFAGYEEEDMSILSITAEELLRKRQIKKDKKGNKRTKISPNSDIVKNKEQKENVNTDLSSEEVEIESRIEETEYENAPGESVTTEMRTMLLEWMYDVKIDYKLSSTVYQIAVRITDKYFIEKDIKKDRYQLLGAVSLFIANKLLARKSTSLSSYLDACDGAFTRKEFLECERSILMKIGEFLNFILPMQIIKEDRFLLGNALTEYSSEAVLLDPSYGSLSPKELSFFIDSNVVEILAGRHPSDTFLSLLKQSPGILSHQIKQVRDLVHKL